MLRTDPTTASAEIGVDVATCWILGGRPLPRGFVAGTWRITWAWGIGVVGSETAFIFTTPVAVEVMRTEKKILDN